MPEKLDSCVKKLIKSGKSKSAAFAICTASLKKSGELSEFKLSDKIYSGNSNSEGERDHYHKVLLTVENKNKRINVKGKTTSMLLNFYDGSGEGRDTDITPPEKHDHEVNVILSANILGAYAITKAVNGKNGDAHAHELYIDPARLLYLQNIKVLKEGSLLTWLDKSYDIENYDEIKLADPKAKVRNRGNVVFPAGSSKVKDNKDHFPINNIGQARNALARMNQYDAVPPWYSGTLEELKNAIRRKIKSKYPTINIKANEKIDVKYFK